MTKPLALDDVYRFQTPGDPDLSPDGSRVAYVLTGQDRDLDGAASAIWLVPTDEGQAITELEVGGRDRLVKLSPLTHVDAVRAPTLILHGAADERCPTGQAEQWFQALRTRGVKVQMVLYPGGSHLFLLSGRPSHRIDYSRRLVDWVTAHTGTDRASAAR
jgi:dipeptidyl aminopeptidase/acylaminoacyl peptidase